MKNISKNMYFVVKQVYLIDKMFYFWTVVKICLDSLSPFIMIIFPKIILDAVSSSVSITLVFIYIFELIAISLLVGFLSTKVNSLLQCKKIKIDDEFQLKFGNRMLYMDYANLENKEILNRFEHSIDSLAKVSLVSAIELLAALLTNIGIFLGTLYIISFLGAVIIPIFFVVMAVNTMMQKKRADTRYNFERENFGLLREARYSEKIMTDISFAKEIRLNNMQDFVVNNYQGKLNQYNFLWRKSIGMRIFQYFICFFLEAVRDVAIYAYTAYKFLMGIIGIGSFSMYIASALNFSKSINGIFSNIVDINYNVRTIKDICYFYNLNNNYNKSKELGNMHDITEDICIEFKNVDFKYPGHETYAIKGMNISLKKNEKLSVVGENGAGKTTFIKLLLRLYEPTNGEILLNGINIKNYDYKEYLKIFSATFQDFVIFPFQLIENISFNEKYDRKRMDFILDKLGLDKVIKFLQQGENTYVSKKFDDLGVELSGGEQQKLIIARTLFRDSKINIFDEPTSALSPIAEYEILNNFNELVADRIVVYISHRLACCKFCDKIAVFNKGEIVEYGKHEELIMKNGLYSKMYAVQANYDTNNEMNCV